MSDRHDQPQYAFVITQIGEEDSPERRRADSVTNHIIKPVLGDFGLVLRRADQDPTPGQITSQLLRSLLEARVVIADLTGRSANVYYELGVAHSFSRPVVPIIDKGHDVAFDTKDQRLIVIGEHDAALTVEQAERAKTRLRSALRVVLMDGFVPSSIIADVATSRSIDQLAPDNPVASELSALRDSVEDMRAHLAQLSSAEGPTGWIADYEATRVIIRNATVTAHPDREALLRGVDFSNTSLEFDKWITSVLPPDGSVEPHG